MAKMSAEEIQGHLAQFTGTEDWHQFSGMFKSVIATDGAMEMAKICEAYWLLDLVASHQRKISRKHGITGLHFQHWTIKKRPRAGGFIVSCDDGNGNKLATQTVPHSDFPMDEFSFYCNLAQRGVRIIMTILLKTEY